MRVRIGSTASAGTCPSAGQGALDDPGAHSFDRAGVKVSRALKKIKVQEEIERQVERVEKQKIYLDQTWRNKHGIEYEVSRKEKYNFR